jgi:hypothetical protein
MSWLGMVALEINRTIAGLNRFPLALKRCSAAAYKIGWRAPTNCLRFSVNSFRSASTGAKRDVVEVMDKFGFEISYEILHMLPLF